MIEFSYKLDWRWLVLGVALAAVWVFWSYTTAVGRPKGRSSALLCALRWFSLAAVACCLLDPQWVERIKHQQPSRLAVLLDTSRSMSIRDVNGDRLSSAKSWLRETVSKAPPGVSLSWFGFDQNCQPLAKARSPAAQPFDNASPTGGVTALTKALDQLLTSAASDPLIGVVLCSDGIETTDQDPLAVARLYRRKGVPIHTVTFGTTNDPRDIIVENVQVKRAVLNQARSRVAVLVRSSGFQKETVPVQLRFRDQVIAQSWLVLTGGLQRVELEFAPRLKGYHIFEASVPAQRDEWLTTNNRRPFGLEVIDPTIRVIYMEGTPTQGRQPEWKYLKDALESDPNIKCKAMFRFPDSSGAGLNSVDVDPDTGDKVYHVQHPTQGYPRTLAGLLEYDVVINSDIVREAFSAEQLLNTTKLVEEYGGGFVMVGGKKAFGAGGYHRTILDKFVPVAMETDSDTSNNAFQLAVVPSAWNHPLIAFGASREETMAIWTTKFPRLYGFNRVGRAKPGAFVLAVNPGEQNAYGARIIFAAQEVGKGRTLAFTSDTTRSWGKDFETVWGEKSNDRGALNEMNCDARYFRHFWINAIRWLAANKVGNTNGPVTLELAHTVSRPGESVPVLVRVLDRTLKETAEAEVAIELAAPNQTNRVFNARYDATARLYRAAIAPLAAATYTLIASANLQKSKLGEDKQLLVCEDTDPEMEKICANPELMASLARLSGGKSFNPEDTDATTIRNLFGNVPPVTFEVRRTPIWDRSTWMLLIFALLTAEWVLRRLRGLA